MIERMPRLAAQALTVTGCTLDIANKMSQDGLAPAYLLGHNTWPENHIGNFLTSATLALIFSRIALPALCEKNHWQVSEKDLTTGAFLITWGLNIVAETYRLLLGSNMEFWGDIACGAIAAGLLLYGVAGRHRPLKANQSSVDPDC